MFQSRWPALPLPTAHRPEARQPLQDAREGVPAPLQSRVSIEGERAAQLMRLPQPFVDSQSAGA